MDMIEVRTSDLVGAALDWAVGIAEGWEPDRPQDGQLRKTWRGCTQYAAVGKDVACADRHRYTPSTDWRQGGPLIEKLMRSGKWELVQWCGAVAFQNYNNECVPVDGESWDQESMIECGETPLIAACRAIVASKLGAAVQVPAHLVEGKA